MSSWGFAPVVTRVTFSASDVATEIADGEPIRVWGFAIANTGTSSTQVVTIQSGDGNTTYYSHTFGNGEFVMVDIKFIADKGLRVVSTGADFADLNCIFFHSNPGS